MKTGDKRKFLETAQKRFERAVQAEHKQRERWLDDLRFEAGEQWPEAIRRLREKDPTNPRPVLTINKAQLHVRQVCNDIRQNRPQIKVLPVDGNADIHTADIYSGLIRNIESVSDADIAYDTSIKPCVTAGIGYFALMTEVVDARLNQQEIRFRTIWNPLSVYMDPDREHPAGQDARWAFIVEDMSEAEFERLYPKAKAVDWREKSRGDATSWYPDNKTVRVAEYYYLERKDKTFHETDEGEIYDDEGLLKAGNPPVIRSRTQKVDCCYWAKITAVDILEETEVPSGPYIPICRVGGRETVIEGERDTRGMVRDMRDPCRIYNYFVTLNTENIALSPKAPFVGAWKAIEGHEDSWQRANTDNLPYLPYNHLDEDTQQILPPPQRAQPPQQSTAVVQAIIQADNDIMGVAGRFEASLGEGGNEKSGRAIIARQRQGDNATFDFADNLTRALRYAGRILVEMIPKVYDTPRILRVLGEDGSTEFADIDPSMPKPMVETTDLAGKVRKVYNLGVGRYDVTCIAGPSYATKRQEAADMLTQLSQSDPTLMQKAGDLIVNSFDLPGADKLSKRLKMFLPPEIAQQEQDDEPDPQAMMAQAQQAAQQQMMAEVQPVMQELQQALQTAEQEAQQTKSEIAALKQQLANREQELQLRAAELTLKREEMTMKSEAEAAKGESEIVRMVLEKALMPEPEVEDEGPDETAQAVQALMSQMDELREAVSKPRKKQVRVTEFDADGLPVAAEVIEE
jgi:hypothetical protein